MKRWWIERSTREQVFVLAAAAVLAVLMLYEGLVRPLALFHSSARQVHADAMAYLADVQSAARTIQDLKTNAQGRQSLGEGGLRAAATVAAQETGATISRMQPLNDDAIEFTFDNAATPQIYRWLTMLNDRHGLQIIKVNIQRNGKTEDVRAQVIIAPMRSS